MPEPPYHIAFVLTSFGRGGMEMRLADLVNGLDKSRWNSHIYAFYDRQTMRDKVMADRLHTPLANTKTDLNLPLRLSQIFKREQTTIVWTLTQGLAAGWGRLAAIGAGVPIRILSIHDSAPLAPLTRSLNPWTDAIVCNSQYSRDKLAAQGINPAKLHVLYNGIDTVRYSLGADERVRLFGISAQRPVILNVGRLFPEKGRDVMLQATVDLIHKADPHQSPPLIVFAGEGAGSQRSALESLSAKLGIAEYVRFLGIRDDIPALMRSADVLVMSSHDTPFGESCPNVILEALACGLPVIATQVGGAGELIREGKTGYLIPPSNPHALSQALDRILSQPDYARQMGQKGRREVMARFSLEQMIEGRAALLESLISEKL